METRLAEIEEDCLEELLHIVSATFPDEEVEEPDGGQLNKDLKMIAATLPIRKGELAEIVGENSDLLSKCADIILEITQEYHQMKRKIVLEMRKKKNLNQLKSSISKMSSGRTQDSLASTQNPIDSNLNDTYLEEISKVDIVKVKLNSNKRTDSASTKSISSLEPLIPKPDIVLESVFEKPSISPMSLSSISQNEDANGASLPPSRMSSYQSMKSCEVLVPITNTNSAANLSLSSLVPPTSSSSRPSEIPTISLPEDNMLSVAVAEVVSPSKMYINLASHYGELSLMMDELDAHYEGQLAAAEGDKAAVAQWAVDQAGLGVGDLVAVTWRDNMWYRGRVTRILDHATLRVFYVDYGTTASIKRSLMFPLHEKFWQFPAQAIEVELAGIEPPCDEFLTVKWSSQATRRINELCGKSHETSLEALIVNRKKEGRSGLWILDHNGNGINETLVEEGLARFVDDEMLNSMLANKAERVELGSVVQEASVLEEEILALGAKENDEECSATDSLFVRAIETYERFLMFERQNEDKE